MFLAIQQSNKSAMKNKSVAISLLSSFVKKWKINTIFPTSFDHEKGSILAYSMIILAMMLAIATSISVSTIIEKKNASGTEFSMQSLQTADSGAQRSLKKINKNLILPINSATVYGASCNGGVVMGLSDAGLGTYDLYFYTDVSGTVPANCNALANTIKSIKSVGTYKNTVRAVSVVAKASGP